MVKKLLKLAKISVFLSDTPEKDEIHRYHFQITKIREIWYNQSLIIT